MTKMGATSNATAKERINTIRRAFPKSGLFANKKWRISSEPLSLPKKITKELNSLGHLLANFLKASNTIYNQSVKNKVPDWVHSYLDAGKPADLIEKGRHKTFNHSLPRIIRPDLIWTEDGFAITELDSIPGGIGLTAWLNQTYSDLGYDVLGASTGMLDGFASILPKGADILISQESSEYRPEMEWLSEKLNSRFSSINFNVLDAEQYQISDRDVYRFFELFDLDNIPSANDLFEAAANSQIDITPPFKPYMEEKMWSALFHSRPLLNYWAAQIRQNHLKRLSDYFPFSWIIDPSPIPHHAELPSLGINDWHQLAGFSQKERDLVIKISGFSELAWGSRSVRIGSDMPANEWKEAIELAIHDFPDRPWIMQRFKKARVFKHSYWDEAMEKSQSIDVRARICPYYFLSEENSSNCRAELGGVMATLVPSNKKIIHGMSEAIIVPCIQGP